MDYLTCVNIKRGSEVAVPSMTFVFIGENERSIQAGVFYIAYEDNHNQFTWCGIPEDRHNGAGNLGFVDGHVEAHRWMHTPKEADGLNRSRAVDDLDRQDLLWLLERTPYWHWSDRDGPTILLQ